MSRFAQFVFEGHNISIMNGHFDTDHPDKVVHKGEHTNLFDDLKNIALAPNTHKFVLNFWDEDLRREYERVKDLNISETLRACSKSFPCGKISKKARERR